MIQKSTISGVLTITLNQPERRNAFNDEVIAELTRAFEEADVAPDVRVVVLAARGRAFCAGADLNWMRKMADYSHAENRVDAAALARMLHSLYGCSKPTIAKIQGDVYAGGVGLVAACDMAVAVEGARFCLSEVKLGLIPATISPYVIRAMGARHAHRYFLTAEVFDASEALRMGFVHAVTSPDALDARVQQMAEALLQCGPQATVACKRLLQEVAHKNIDGPLISYTVEQIAAIRASAEGREGVASFLERRPPAWLDASKGAVPAA
ncbi:enoyl-CoA hydratase [Rhodoferax lacus]|uniref:Enoyl-CoA hydratase n=1 Tax=Rhodoferax lacus TaxID=2184758 RepID=A0A3E1R7A1_9BURK|nr:enoyl-CoA hydratase/isomerase family protein [Rhodoferax lacus]RFO95234.1 enoyl-CoA hydratase [Rhodoferax lacus]